jgi:dTDP-4-dehydrorhamnose 3,5-epimerase-like enzyme
MNKFYKIIDLQSWKDDRGEINIINKGKDFNFDIKRIYFFKNKINNITRGFHAQKKNHSIFVPINGNFIITLRNKTKKVRIHINSKNNQAIYIKPKIWREIIVKNKNFSCFIINSHFYNKNDYIFDIKNLD